MRFSAPLLLAAAVSATTVEFKNLKLTSNNSDACTLCTDVNGGDTMALQVCLMRVPAECTYTVDATLTGEAKTCATGFGIEVMDNLASVVEGLEVTEMEGNLDLTLDATTGDCTLTGSASDDSTQQCNGSPAGTDITATLKNGQGQLPLDKVIGRYIGLKATTADTCGTKITAAKVPTAGATAKFTARGLGGAAGNGGNESTDPSGDGSASDGVAPLLGASLFISLLGALHIA